MWDRINPCYKQGCGCLIVGAPFFAYMCFDYLLPQDDWYVILGISYAVIISLFLIFRR